MGWKRYVALGDSFTEGVGDPRPGGRERGWADRVAESLAGPDKTGFDVDAARFAVAALTAFAGEHDEQTSEWWMA